MTPEPKPIIVLPTSTKPHILTELRKGGYIPVLCDQPDKVVVVLPSSRVAGDDFLMAALAGVAADAGTWNTCSKAFFAELHRRMMNREKEKSQPTAGK